MLEALKNIRFTPIYPVSVKILLIDDSRFLRMANERALTLAGHEVLSAADGEEGLRLACEQKPDLVVLDLMLPKLPGLEVLRKLRSRPDTASMPVVVISGLSQANDQKLVSEGATSYFEKSRLMLDRGSDTFVETINALLAKAKRASA
ncbi:MAG TPA: response regulator [Terriglobales bacterium]|nr:response regulator [Terriglobales bacterium]